MIEYSLNKWKNYDINKTALNQKIGKVDKLTCENKEPVQHILTHLQNNKHVLEKRCKKEDIAASNKQNKY